MADFPNHPKDITLDWLREKTGARAIEAFDYAAIGTGQVADSYRLTLQGDPQLKSVVIKCSAADETSRNTAKSMRLYAIEANWYREFAPKISCRAPTPYYVACNEEGSDYILLLEDLAPAEQIDQITGASEAEITLALNEAALLHAAHWNDTRIKEIAWLTRDASSQNFVRDFLPQIYPDWCARYAGRIEPAILEMGEALVARYESYMKPRPAPLVLSHGDLRLDNMLYRDQAGRAIVLDWQTVSAGAPMGDIAYCITTSFADHKICATREQKLVAHYLERLRAAGGGTDYSDEAAWADYRHAAFAGFLMGVISAMLVERTARGDEMFAVMAERSAHCALRLDSLSLI